jgi:uncharacterized protein
MFKRMYGKNRRVQIIELLSTQIEFSVKGSKIAKEACLKERPERMLRDEMNDVEHRGDEARRELVRSMRSTLTSHLEREDIFRISRSIDDVLDNLRDFVREISLWRVTLGHEAVEALANVELSLKHLGRAVTIRSLSEARSESLAASRYANTLRRHYQDALAEIFSEALTMDTLKKRESMRRIDVIGLRLTEASDAILDGLIKRSL